jgi:adenosylmethionine-8-amino-7-oxononanoate aminotransferase
MTHLMRRFLKAEYPVAVGGDGPYVIAADGRRYLDGSSGAGVSSLGYSQHRIIEAICDQARRLTFCYNANFTTEPAERLADELARLAPGNLNWVFPGSGGSESIDGALKLARQYHLDAGQPERTRFVTRRQSYHGCTLGALGVGVNPIRRTPFEPLLRDPLEVSPCYEYRDRRDDESPEEYGARLVAELDETLERAGSRTVAAFIAEPIVAATSGAVGPVPGYFQGIRRVCDKHGALLILDEIFTGVWRTGTFLACEQEGVVPDIAVIAKSLAAGYQPISALLVGDRVFNTLADRRGYFMHGHTYGSHATACAAALATLQVIQEEQLAQNVRTRGAQLMAGLRERFRDHPHVGDIRGRGMMFGLELVADRVTKEPFPTERLAWLNITRAAFEEGLLCYPMGGTIDGVRGDHVLLAPPYIYTAGHVEELLDKLATAIDTGLRRPAPRL